MPSSIVYIIKNEKFQPDSETAQSVGSDINTGIRNTTANPNLGFLESIDKSVKEGVKGTEAWHGSGGIGSTGTTGAVGVAAGAIAKFDDVATVSNNLLAGKFLEASMEATGAFAGPLGGAAVGFAAQTGVNALGAAFPVPAFLRTLAIGYGIYQGDKTTGDLAKEFTYGEWIQATAPSIPANAGLQPAQTINGVNYYVVSATDHNGAPRTFVYTDSGNATGSDPLMFPNQPRYMPVVDQNISKQVVNGVLTDIGFDPNISLPQWNVMQGKSPSGYALNTTNYENSGSASVSGAGPDAVRTQSTVQVTTYKDAETGATMEVRLSGRLVNGQFQADSAPALVAGMDTAGRTILTGEAARSIAASQMAAPNNSGAGQEGGASSEAELPVVHVGASNGYTSVSIQNHGNGAQSLEFTNEDGSHAWVMQNPGTGGRTVVLTNAAGLDGEARTIVYEIAANDLYWAVAA